MAKNMIIKRGAKLGAAALCAAAIAGGGLALDAGVAGATGNATITVTGGSLTLTAPTTLTWAVTLNGSNQTVVDAVSGDQQMTVNDATGTGAGWHITVSGTTFTNGAHTLPDAGTFSTTGSKTSSSAATGYTTACVAATTCTLPTNSTSYPVAVTTAASSPTAVTIFDTAAATGVGQILIGGSASANPVGWWVNVPSNAFAGAYTSTVTIAIVSGP